MRNPFFTQVEAFCDVDEKKLQKGFYTYEESQVWIWSTKYLDVDEISSKDQTHSVEA